MNQTVEPTDLQERSCKKSNFADVSEIEPLVIRTKETVDASLQPKFEGDRASTREDTAVCC